jgi:hypothetical protein
MSEAAGFAPSRVQQIIARVRAADPVLLWGAGLALLGIIWTLFNLATRSLWWDELFTITLAEPSTPLADTMTSIREDVHPPFYFLAERMWLGLLQQSGEFAARSLNVIPYLFAIGVAVWSLRRKIAQPMALWLALFFTSFGFLWYLQEARMYAFMIAQSVAGIILVLDWETQKAKRIDAGYVALLVATFVVMPLGHWFSVAFAGSLLIGMCVWALLEKRMAYFWLFFSAGTALALAGGAWLVSNYVHTLGAAGGYGGHIYGGTLSVWGVRTTLTGILLYGLTLNPILIAAAGFGLWTFIADKKRPASLVVIAVVSAALSLAIFAISIKAPMYQTRNFVFLIAPLTLFAAIGLTAALDHFKQSRRQHAMALVLLVGFNALIAPFAGKVFPLELDEWRSAGRYVAAQPGCATAEIPVLTDWLSPAASDARKNQSRRMYGYYAGQPDRMKLVMPGDRLTIDRNAACPVTLWVAQMSTEQAEQRARAVFGPAADELQAVRFAGHTVFTRQIGPTAALR